MSFAQFCDVGVIGKEKKKNGLVLKLAGNDLNPQEITFCKFQKTTIFLSHIADGLNMALQKFWAILRFMILLYERSTQKVDFLLKHFFRIPPSLYRRNSLRIPKKTFSIFFDIFVKKIFENFGRKIWSKNLGKNTIFIIFFIQNTRFWVNFDLLYAAVNMKALNFCEKIFFSFFPTFFLKKLKNRYFAKNVLKKCFSPKSAVLVSSAKRKRKMVFR